MQKKYFIDNLALKRLLDPTVDIRLRSLRELTAILKNNIIFAAKEIEGSDDDLTVVSLDTLVRNLILWFRFRPVTNEAEVLDLLILILSRRNLLRHIAKNISITRLAKEFNKIKNLVLAGESYIKLHTILQLLEDYRSSVLIDVANISGSFGDIEGVSFGESTKYSFMSSGPEVDLIERMKKLQHTSPGQTSSVGSKCDEKEEVLVDFWEELNGVSLDTFNALEAELSLYKEDNHLSNVLKFLRSSADDYPPEFFLQPPHILESLTDILYKVSKNESIQIVRQIRFIVNSLKDRWMDSLACLKKKDQKFVSVKKHINHVIRIVNNYFATFHDSFNIDFFVDNQNVLNEIYLLLNDIAVFVKETQNVCEIFVNELLNMMAKVSKDFRLSYPDAQQDKSIVRLHYMILIYTINVLAASIDTKDVRNYCDNNIWEFESDVALLDAPLRIGSSEVYAIIKKNRKKVIKEDKDLMLLLNIKSCWKPVVELFQNWNSLTAREIILKGSEAIDTIRIHKSLEVVDLLLRIIVSSSKMLSNDKKLKEAAEDIYLRLLSIEVIEIRERAYRAVRDSVQMKIKYGSDDLNRENICSVIGFPVSPEIVTEILCFGFTDSCKSIQEQAKLILFTLLRAKVIYAGYWEELLNIIKPILPLMSCLFSLDENMGIINFDVFNQHSGFDENELNQAYARFLYSKNRKARIMAKEKLLSSLDIPSDLINVVPDDFCLLPKALVSNIQMPESSVKYDKEAYEETIAILKEIDRTNIEIVQSIIINLSVMMNSRECCQKSHDDNLWVFFLTQLDMRAPNNEIIRKVTVNILHKWAVSVPSFRIYLANEPKVLEFLINTLIYFQEDAKIKQQTSSLLFLLLFCDFVVTTERSVSMPQFLESMSCPFKFQHHWTESPFNKITALEQLQEMMEAGNDQTNIQQISQRYMKFTFAEVWFKGHIKLAPESSTSTFYYTNRAVKPFTIIKDLMLSDEDVGLLTQSSSNEILKNLSSQLDNTTIVENALRLTFHVQSLLTMPLTCVEGIADSIDKKIERFVGFTSVNDMQQLLFVKVMEIYQRIVKMLTDQKILNLLKKQFFVDLITTDATFNDEVFVAGLSLLNCIVKQCRGRPSLMKLLIETYEKKHQVYLPSKIVEKLWNYLTSGVMTDVRKWKEINYRLAVKVTLMVIRNVLSIMPIRLNDTFLTNVMFCFLLDKMRQLYSHQMHHVKASTPLHVHSGMMKQVFGICLTIASHVKRLPMKQSTYISLLFWVAEEQRKHKALPWMIIAELTKNKEDFESFCKGFESAMGVQFICTVSSALLDCKTPSNLSFLDQKAIVSVIANILDHDVTPSLCGFDLSALQLMLAKLAELNNVSAFGFLVRKMIQSNTTATDCLVLTFDLIRKFLDYEVPADVCAPTYQKIADQFESAVCCYQYEPLKAFVEGLVVNELDLGFIQMFVDTQEKPEAELKKFNHNGFNLLLILIQSDAGMVRLCSALNEPRNIDRMIYASHDSLRTANTPSELIFQLGFWCSVLHSCEKFESPLMDVISTNLLDLSSGRCMFIKKTDENGNLRNDSILEREFNSVRYSIDLLFLQVASIFEFVYSSKLSAEYKHDIKALCFLIISKLTDNNERVRQLSKETNLAGLVIEKLSLQLSTMQSFRYLETTKKIGAQKSQFMIKDLAIFLKALTEWKLPLASNAKSMRKIFDQLLKVYDWIDADSLLKNCFLNLIQAMSALDVGKSCLLHEIEGKPLLKTILKKTQALSVKPPHTETNLALIKNGIATLTTCSRFVEVRIMLKNCKVFEMLECLHPQIQNNRKSSWDRVTMEWLKFFEFLSKYDDTECLPNHVSLLCRMFRLGNSAIKRLSLVIIRNFSTKGPIGSILLNSEDFKQTADAILSDSTDADEKSLILQTLLSIVSKGEQSKAKLKNSSLNRKLKDQLAVMQSDSKFQGKPENQIIINLTTMLNNVLYFKESC